MEDAGFIIGSYVLTAVTISAYVVWFFRSARKLDEHATDEDKPWI